MTPDERDILIRLDAKADHLCKELKEFKDIAMSEQGFPRCAKHAQAVDDLKESMKWSRRIVLSAISLPIIGYFAKMILAD